MPAPRLSDVQEAAARLAGHAVRTPLITSPALDAATGGRIFIKAECLQRTGSFKFRGAFNRISQLPEAARARGVVAYSSGNHAQGVAEAARLLGAPATIVIPQDAPAAKRKGTAARGATIVAYDRLSEDREAIGADIAARTGATLTPPYDHPHIIAGQG
ncbi:MAG: pyridoxal-phosphate dependent enzyme, partial [Caulobacterales bacterium]|nr:pyridoxal-phosphate dependent enzyme [Caulobacterales bacterium]